MAAHVRMRTKHPIVVHPHAENAALRRRATEFYRLFGHTAVKDMHAVAEAMGLDYIVFDRYSCVRQCTIHGESVGGYEYLVHEGEPEAACSILGPGNHKVPKFCTIVSDDNYHAKLLPPYFERVFVPKNRAYYVLRVLGKKRKQPGSDKPKKKKAQKPPGSQPTTDKGKGKAEQGKKVQAKEAEPPPSSGPPCFEVRPSVFESLGTTMDAELYASHLPRAVIAPRESAAVAAEARAVIHIESVDEAAILASPEPLHMFMVSPTPCFF